MGDSTFGVKLLLYSQMVGAPEFAPGVQGAFLMNQQVPLLKLQLLK